MTDPVETEPVPDTGDQAAADEPRRWSWAFALPIGIGAAIIGLVPWLLRGARLPLQNLWERDTLPGAMPIALLPFSQYFVILIFSLLVVGAAVAGIAGRALRVRGWGLVLLLVGVLLVQVTATVQTANVVRDGLQDRLESSVYLIALVGGTGLSILVGILVTVLVARAPRAGALLGLTVGAIGMASWTGALIDPTGVGAGPLAGMLVILPWIAPVLTGVAIAWAGVNTAGRVLAALASLVLIWVAPAVTTAIFNALGSRVLIRSGTDMIDYGLGVFQAALLTPELALRPIIATVVVAAVGLVIRALVTRGRHRQR
ncbi:hypothetical protein SAMN04487846_1711 [Microbacterium sp. cf046]|uniref:hypothetical protein n=1 Tax=Microbacterium sp. cf046 TaxID=1761803 RepID=UPI0008EA273E|nr:hypothetical protein [Microbacterium sp. cf046]SFS03831.1 hypothetical protein SAMN04487846_1711 [Microbacterium sp. cf046]